MNFLKQYKSAIIIFCLALFMFYSFIPPKKANAIFGADDVLVVGGITVTGEMLIGLAGATLIAGGATIYANTDSTDLRYIADGLIKTGQGAKYIASKIDTTGKRFLSWTSDGLSWFNEKISTMVSDGSISPSLPIGSDGYTNFGSFTVSPSNNSTALCVVIIPSLYLPSTNVHYKCNVNGTFVSGVLSTARVGYNTVGAIYSNTYRSYSIGVASPVTGFASTGVSGSTGFISDFSLDLPDGSICAYPVGQGSKTYDDTLNQDVIGGTSVTSPMGIPLSVGNDGSISAPAVPYGQTWNDVVGDFTYTPSRDTTGDITGDTTVGDTTGSISDGVLNIPILGAILKALLDILAFLKGFLLSLINAFKDLLISLFVPKDTFFKNNFDGLKSDLISKIGYQQYIDVLKSNFTGNALKDITINWHGQTIVIVKLTTFEKFRSLFNSCVYGFMFFGLAIYNYNQIYRIFRGNSYAKMSQTIDNMKK